MTDKSNIQLKGFIDRIDEVRDVVRIIDYKSGSGTTQFTSVEALFDKADTDRSKAVMQVFMYAWMFNRSVQLSTAIQPGIYYMRTLFSSSFDPEFTIVQTGSKQNRFWTSPTIARILKTACEIAWMKSSTQKPHSCKPRTAKPACIVRLRIFAENSVFTDFPYIHPQFHSGSG